MTQQAVSCLKLIENQELAGITFIRDYLQFLFDGPYLNGYVWPRLTIRDKTFTAKADGYRDALCGQIGKRVIKASHRHEEVVLRFDDGSEIGFSVKEEDKAGPDAVLLQAGDTWCAW
jgi:hypothetical protein